MSEKKERLLKLRSTLNRRRPKFKRENYFRLKRIQTSWRAPKGIDSKMRHSLKGKRKSVNPGYRGPRLTRHLHPMGKELVQVSNLKELEAIDVETQVAQIRGTVGSRKRYSMITYAEDNDIHIINPQVRVDSFDDEDLVEDEFIEIDDDVELIDEEDDE